MRLRVTREAQGWVIEAVAVPPLDDDTVVQIVRYRPEVESLIARGENAGRRAVYANVVTEWISVAEWDGAAPLRVEAILAGPERAAVVVQSLRQGGKYATLPGPILAAARLD